MFQKLAAVVRGDGLEGVPEPSLPQLSLQMVKDLSHGGRLFVGQFENHRLSRLPLQHRQKYIPAFRPAHYQIHLPVAAL